MWDQYRQAGPAPSGYGYGTEADLPEDIAAMGSDTANVYSYSTHGTHVAGIAAGGGAGVGPTGMAPAAELLFATLMVDEAAALDAFEWMAGVAEADGKRLVINNSWGLPQWGTPDGTALSNTIHRCPVGDGVVFVSSNGNNGDSSFPHRPHLSTALATPSAMARVQFYPLSANPNALKRRTKSDPLGRTRRVVQCRIHAHPRRELGGRHQPTMYHTDEEVLRGMQHHSQSSTTTP